LSLDVHPFSGVFYVKHQLQFLICTPHQLPCLLPDWFFPASFF
jgi:hypothetical protein